MPWRKRIVEWIGGETLYLSVPFTWLLPDAKKMSDGLANRGYYVRVGGPAVRLMPDYINQHACLGDDSTALERMNPDATFTTRGCDRGCSFCGVSLIEGSFRELREFTPKPIVCDSNFLQSSDKHFNRVIDSLKGIKGVDFNQGLDARRLTPERASRLLELDLAAVRFAWDSPTSEKAVFDAIALMRKQGCPKNKINVYCIFNHKDTFAYSKHRMETLKELGFRGFAMRYQPLDCLVKNEYVADGWIDRECKKFARYWNRQSQFAGVDYECFSG